MMVLIVILTFVVLAVFAVAFILLLGEVMGCWSGAAFIVGGVYLLGLAATCLITRRRLMKSYSQAGNWRPMALFVVRYLRSLLDS